MTIVAISLVVGLVGALAATRLLNSLLYGVGASDPLTFIAIVVLVSADPGHALSSQKRGNEQTSALFENGVTVPIRGSGAAQRASASSHPAVTIVSEFNRTISPRA